MNDLVVSFIRTYVPIFVGSVLSWAAAKGLDIDAQTGAGLIVFLTGVLIAAYYGVVRLLERQWPQLGVLLGSAKKPEYTAPK